MNERAKSAERYYSAGNSSKRALCVSESENAKLHEDTPIRVLRNVNKKTVQINVVWKPLVERVALRFFTGALSGALGTLATISVVDLMNQDFTSWSDLGSALARITLAVAVGAATGGLEALRKYLSARKDY